jgi:adenylate cyclase
VAYDSQLSERRAQLHVAVAQALEALDPAKLDERAALLAHHWEQAGNALEAAAWYRRAAIWTGFNNLVESHRHWRKVRALLDSLPESQETIARGAEVRGQLIAFALRFGGPSDEITALFQQAKEFATRSGNLRALIFSLGIYGMFKLYSGDVRASLEAQEDALRRADQTADRALQLVTRAGLGLAYANAGRLSEALARADEAIELSQRDPDLGSDLIGYSPYLFVLGVRGIVYAEMGRYPEAERDLDRALGLARQRGELLTALVAQGFYVAVWELTGNAQAARSRAREAVDLAEKVASPVARVFGYGFLGRAHALNEEWDEALGILNQGVAIAREHQTGLQFEAGMLASLAGVHRGLGDVSAARAVAEEAIGVARRSGTKINEIRAQIGLARALLQAQDVSSRGEIESALDSAMSLVEETGADGYRPLIHEARAELARVLGDESGAGGAAD